MGKYTADQNEQYYKVRLDPYKLHHSKGMKYRAICPLHPGGDNPEALSVDLHEGNFVCFTKGCKGGSIHTFEMLMLQIEGKMHNVDQVNESIATILGTPFIKRIYPESVQKEHKGWNRDYAQARYKYVDEQGRETLTVYRFIDREGEKKTPCDRPCVCSPDSVCDKLCDKGRIWNSDGVRRVLYRLPDVLQSMLVFVVEGEKNVDDLSKALAGYIKREGCFEFGGMNLDRIGVTTNQGGALAWKSEYGYGKYFTGKTVIKLSDNDASGIIHREAACADIATHAREIYTLDLPVGHKQDISDYLQIHKIDDLFKLLPQLVRYGTPEKKHSIIDSKIAEERDFLVVPSRLVGLEKRKKEWLIEGLIEKGQRGLRGLVVARPKTGKSLLFLEIAVCLGSGKGLFGGRPYPRPVKVAVFSREDGPEMVQERLYQLGKGHNIPPHELDQNILVNTNEQYASLNVQYEKDRKKMVQWLTAAKVEFCIIDVLEQVHLSKENSNDEMKLVMRYIKDIGVEADCQMCVIHHTREDGGVKGATSIEGWADYTIKLESDPQDTSIKTLKLITRGVAPRPDLKIKYTQTDDLTESRIILLQAVEESRPNKDYKSRASDGYYQ